MAFKRLLPVPILPHDVLRLMFEYAATDDKTAAMSLALVSRLSQRWVDPILYEVVNLHRQSTSRSFLRTIETCTTKPRSFFAKSVKSLCISDDIFDEHIIKIISTCRGLTSLTFWIVPLAHVTRINSTVNSTACHGLAAALAPLRPRRLSVLLYDVLCSPTPQFHLPFFGKITHLAIVNKWEDWTRWTGFSHLPCLTHLSFDIRVGPRPLTEGQAFAIAWATNKILLACPRIRVCVLLLLFDAHPKGTATAVTKHLARPDPRLVFLRDTEPFRDREAHSEREAEIWAQAVDIVAGQRAGSEHTVFEI